MAGSSNSNNHRFPDNESAKYIWLGRFQFQLILSQLIASNNPPKTPLARLKESYSRLISKDLSFANLCRYLSLHFPFPECGGSAEEELYLFLGRMSQDRDRGQIAAIQNKISEYLKKLPLHYLNASTDSLMFMPAESREQPNHLHSTGNPSATTSSTHGLQGQTNRRSSTPTTRISSPVPSMNKPREEIPLFSAVPTAAPGAMKTDPPNVSSNTAATTTATTTAAPAAAATPANQYAQYTVQLKEKGDAEGAVTQYEEVREQENPPIWRVVATYGSGSGSAMGIGWASTKKQAKHFASKDVLVKLNWETV